MELIFDPEKLSTGKLYKVVQITTDGDPRTIFTEHIPGLLHSMILQGFLRTLDIPYKEVLTGNGLGPDTRGSRYIVDGMGGAQLLSRNRIKFFGDSFAYGLKISDAHLDRLREEYPDWTLITMSSFG